VLAGGTDIIVMARERRRDTSVFVDIKGIPEMVGIRYDAAGGLTLGAATPLYQIYRDATVNRVYPAIVDSASLIGGTAIQGRASLGGNLCTASPAAVPPAGRCRQASTPRGAPPARASRSRCTPRRVLARASKGQAQQGSSMV
jgi:carbon-monoxide dehydrogenase medium subunit